MKFQKLLSPFSSLLIAALLLITTAPVFAQSNSFIIPTFSITKIEAGKTVTVETKNFPANDSFDVLMNKFGTLGKDGTKVETVSSDKGGVLTFTFNIPEALKNEGAIAIRFQSPKSGYYSYNWFWNQTAVAPTPGVPNTGDGKTPTPTPKPSIKVPTFTIQSVVKDGKVTIVTKDFPANDTFDVLMGQIGTMGVKGEKVDSVTSGDGSSKTVTFNVPDALKGKTQIAIRLQSPTSGYYSYNWFWNVSTP